MDIHAFLLDSIYITEKFFISNEALIKKMGYGTQKIKNSRQILIELSDSALQLKAVHLS